MLDLGERLLKSLPRTIVSNRFQGPRSGPGLENALNRPCVKGLVAGGVCESAVYVIAAELLLELQDEPGVEPAIAGMFSLESG